MQRDELKRLIQGPFCTVPTAFDGKYKLDLGVMANLTRWWVDQGMVAGTTVIKVAAALGEGPDLADDEWPHLLRTVVNAAGGKAAVVCGLKCKNTLHTIEDARKAQDLGAIGLQIDLPIFHHPTQEDMVRFYAEISAAVDIGIMIYNTWWFGTASLTAESMVRLADAEHVVAIKWLPGPGQDYDDMRQFAHIVNVIDNSGQAIRCHRNGGRGYVNVTAQAYPAYDLGIWKLLEARKYDAAQARIDQVRQPLIPFLDKVGQRSGGYNVTKAMMAVMGHPVGAPRPPTLPLNEVEMTELRALLIGCGWPVPQA
ncbi:MAG: dihydrodipicolinate synthase family protein [Chloroflexi bacterium]|nr:dihydrodipicolinate synthase family protein [Chloroflexota bacterium]